MKKGTKKLIGYGLVGVAIYYMFMQTKRSHDEVQTMVQTQVRASSSAPKFDSSELQLYGMGNPPNWY